MRDKPRWEIIHGDSLTVLESFPPSTFDAVITDPPYASGGRTQAEKSKATAKKYSSMGGNAPPDFDGDAKDQRSWTRWAAEWLYLARRAAKPGAPVCMFIDWRQLPCASDALQWAGWIWRGIAVWDKGNSRPQKGRRLPHQFLEFFKYYNTFWGVLCYNKENSTQIPSGGAHERCFFHPSSRGHSGLYRISAV